jgi:hypothetical protein
MAKAGQASHMRVAPPGRAAKQAVDLSRCGVP